MTVINAAGYHREAQMVCNVMLPHEDDILNKFGIWNEKNLQVRKPYQLPGWTKHSPYNNAPAGDSNYDLLLSVESTWLKRPVFSNQLVIEAYVL